MIVSEPGHWQHGMSLRLPQHVFDLIYPKKSVRGARAVSTVQLSYPSKKELLEHPPRPELVEVLSTLLPF